MENKLFTVTYNTLTKEIDVHPSLMETIADHNILHFTNSSDLFMHVYADDFSIKVMW